MIFDLGLMEFICAKSEDDQHFVKDPITLINCGHSICKECLPKQSNQTIKCQKCRTITDKDLRNDKESFIAKNMINKCLSGLSNEMEKQMSENLDKVKSISH
jgi:hypothetical protein